MFSQFKPLLFASRTVLFAALFVVSTYEAAYGQSGSIDQQLATLRTQHLTQLRELSGEWEKESLPRLAKMLRQRMVVHRPDAQTIFPIDAATDELRSEDERENEALDTLRKANREQAEKLYQAAVAAANAERAALAYQLLHEVLSIDPEHAEARRVLGFKQTAKQEWYRPSRKISARRGSTKHSLVGWRPGRYTIVDSGHYRIASTADKETVIRLAEKLERWHNLWRQLYFDYWNDARTLKRWFEGKGSERSSSKKHRVVFFADRDEYVAKLTELGVRGVERSTGYYNEVSKTMFFYAGDADDLAIRSTWLQEQAHQLFQETGRTKKDAIDDSGIWAVEAIAMYFESMTEFERYATFGGFEAQRLQYARIRVNREGFYMPLQELVRLGRKPFQEHPEVLSLYSQSAGLAHFFMMTEQGKYRTPFMEYIKRVYQRRTEPGTLAELIGVEFEQIDKLYRAFLVPSPAHTAFLSKPESRIEIALGASPVTNQQIAPFGECSKLDWLQLSGSRIDDGAAATVARLKKLTQLFVDGTKITDTFLKTVGQLGQLEEIDLASTAITDEGLKQLSGLKKIRVLYLTGTKVTDAGLASLEGMRELEYLEVSNTAITAAGLAKLKQKLPKLK